MSLRALVEATVGRRLGLRIMSHGVLLFAGVLALVLAARVLFAKLDSGLAVRHRPLLAAAAAERLLSRAGDRDALARQLRATEDQLPLDLSVFGPDGALLGSTVEPALPAPRPEECRTAAGRAGPVVWSSGTLVVAELRGGEVAGCAVIARPAAPSALLHVIALLAAALLLAFVFVAAPLTWSIARPIQRLGALARELGAGRLAARANSTRRDEIGDLARSFDAMAGQIQELRAAERELLSAVSHELRTPLARMRVVLELAEEAEVERVRGYLGEVAADLAELEQLTDDVIVSSQLDRDSPTWDPARLPLRKRHLAVEELVQASLRRFRACSPERALTCELTAPGLAVDGDPTMLRRTLDNLLDNARKYSAPSDPIAISVERETVEGRPAVRVAVVDRGIGIAPEDAQRLFSPFFRADRSRARASGGVGLGLALSRRIIEAHGGTIGFTSEVDRGSCFWFTLGVAEDARG